MKAPEDLGPAEGVGNARLSWKTRVQIQDDQRLDKFSVPTIRRRCKTTESAPRRTSDKRATEVRGAGGVRKAATANGFTCKLPHQRDLWRTDIRCSYAVGTAARPPGSANDRCVWQLVGGGGIRRAWKVLNQQGAHGTHRLRQAFLVVPLPKLG